MQFLRIAGATFRGLWSILLFKVLSILLVSLFTNLFERGASHENDDPPPLLLNKSCRLHVKESDIF